MRFCLLYFTPFDGILHFPFLQALNVFSTFVACLYCSFLKEHMWFLHLSFKHRVTLSEVSLPSSWCRYLWLIYYTLFATVSVHGAGVGISVILILPSLLWFVQFWFVIFGYDSSDIRLVAVALFSRGLVKDFVCRIYFLLFLFPLSRHVSSLRVH